MCLSSVLPYVGNTWTLMKIALSLKCKAKWLLLVSRHSHEKQVDQERVYVKEVVTNKGTSCNLIILASKSNCYLILHSAVL